MKKEGYFIIIGGHPGVGKTTLARSLKQFLSCIVISRDDIFRRLFENPNPHSTEHKQKAFKECLRQCKNILVKNETAVLDMPFSRNTEIEAARRLSKLLHKPWRFVYLKCTDEVANQRIRKQKLHLVKPELRINTRTEPLPEDVELMVVDSTPPLKQYINQVLNYIDSSTLL